MPKAHLIIIGNGMACGRLLDEILKRNPDQYRITVFGAEGYANYNRIMLSPVLAGEMHADDIVTHSPQWYQDNHISLHSGDPVVDIVAANKTLTCQSGQTFRYDTLVFATGSNPVMPPVAQDCELDGILSFRKLDDIDRIMARVTQIEHATVVGGGLLGLEAAWGLRQQGLAVTVIHRGEWLLNRQLDPSAGKLLQHSLESRGIQFKLNAEISQFTSQSQPTSDQHTNSQTAALRQIRLKDGTQLNTELAVIAIGVTPNHALAKACGLKCDRGILIDDQLQSSDPHIYALGECTQFGEHTFGLVAPLWDQAAVLADRLCRLSTKRFRVQPCATKLKVSGIDLFSAGEFLTSPDNESVTYQDPANGIYRKLIFRQQRLTGAVLFGAVNDGNWYFELIQSQQKVQHLAPDMIFGRRYCDSAAITESTSDSTTEVHTSPSELSLATGAIS
ncbi:FAD-dependent oxidoreductase [Amphritea sp. 1_MG-2023]|uniref:NAD(P)/FAD-dependent oxidoreductase n=1 Tax=Amphritea sp. 1_MG-2023 TaxID=3062670 RepID=UPI0026E2452F|nr:FAD-dependent oxidoreductase [Amphritea sp. 1_MG-2023]MDO6563847.1 FAD-dependent oxidoreductase [Amphritea sp. 1_MG-2023]